MGYRSEIGLCLAAQAQAALETSLSNLANGEITYTPEEEKLIRALFPAADIRKDENSGTVAYHWSWIKWYSDYPEVRFIESFLATLEDEEYLFLRLGEADDDFESAGAFWDNPLQMSYSRSIAFG